MPRYLDELQFNIDADEGDIDIDVGLADEFQAEIDINVNTGELDIDFGIGDETELGLLSVDMVEAEVEDFISLDIDFNADTFSSDDSVDIELAQPIADISDEQAFEFTDTLEMATELGPLAELDILDDFSAPVFDIDFPLGRGDALEFGDEFGDDFDADDFIFNPKRPFGL